MISHHVYNEKVYINCKQKGCLMYAKIFQNYQVNENIKQCFFFAK